LELVRLAVEVVVEGVLDVEETMLEELDELREELLVELEELDELLDELLLLLLLEDLVEELLLDDELDEELLEDELEVLLLVVPKGPLLQVFAIGAQIFD
jgi:hypothetical protein